MLYTRESQASSLFWMSESCLFVLLRMPAVELRKRHRPQTDISAVNQIPSPPPRVPALRCYHQPSDSSSASSTCGGGYTEKINSIHSFVASFKPSIEYDSHYSLPYHGRSSSDSSIHVKYEHPLSCRAHLAPLRQSVFIPSRPPFVMLYERV